MIVAISATIHELARLGANFKWPQPQCEECSVVMWGHGFVTRYFEDVSEPIRIQRKICPVCRKVAVFRPCEFWPRYRSSIHQIYGSLSRRLQSGRWPLGFVRQRGWYWLNQFIANAIMLGREPLELLQDWFLKKIPFFT